MYKFIRSYKILDVQELPNSITENASILVSRNKPLALVVGVAGCIGSHLAQELLTKGIQVIGIDDFSSGKRSHLDKVIKDKNFHFFESSGVLTKLKFPRLDYAFFMADCQEYHQVYTVGLESFIKFCKSQRDLNLKEKLKNPITHTPRIVLVSTINLYNSKLTDKEKFMKNGEINFAKFVKENKLNARVVRLSAVYGPRMHFREDEPVIRLIHSSLTGNLQSEQTSLDFSTRAIYVDDAVSLLLKTVLSGSTANKIFDGASLKPVKVAEIRQILLDPLWHESRGFNATELPPWPTPNLEKTEKELHWRPKTPLIRGLRETIAYFKENEIEVEEIEKKTFFSENTKKWSFNDQSEQADQTNKEKASPKDFSLADQKRREVGFGRNLIYFLTILLILYGLVLPVVQLGYGVLSIRDNLAKSRLDLEKGDFDKAENRIAKANLVLGDSRQVLESLAIFKRLGILTSQIDRLDAILKTVEEGMEGVTHATAGTKALFQTTKIISGEVNEDPTQNYQTAQAELTAASQKIAKVRAKLENDQFIGIFPDFIKSRATDLAIKLDYYGELVNKARAASFLMPQITAVDGKRSYLVLLQNNLELRPTGGFIGSYAKLTFEKGHITGILVDDIYALDGGLKDIIEPPAEIKTDLGQNRFFLRDSNWEPDFPTSARQAQFFYRREAGEIVGGVFAVNLAASQKLLDAVGGVDLPEYGEHVDGKNLFERSIDHAEVGFFPGSHAKKNYLTSLQAQMFNKIFYLKSQNWPAIIAAIAESLEQKQILIYLDDPQLFSYVLSENWAGLLPRGVVAGEGETRDFLAINEANMGANKANYFVERKLNLETSISTDSAVTHKLTLNYDNSSPSEQFPSGKYKNRLRIYLPLGSKLIRAFFGETDITNQVASFTDYGRSGYSMLIEVLAKETKPLIFEYQLPSKLNFKENLASYRMDIIKQSGIAHDPLEWTISYPNNLEAENEQGSRNIDQQIKVSTDLLKDRSFLFKFLNK